MYDIAIVGGGPAGASAALFAAKAGKKVLLLDSDQGMTRRAWVENHYGVEKISGTDLVDIGLKQAANFGAELVKTKVTNVEKKRRRLRHRNGKRILRSQICHSGNGRIGRARTKNGSGNERRHRTAH